MCGAARELAVALATQGFTDWSCPPDAKQRTFLQPIDDGPAAMIEDLLAASQVPQMGPWGVVDANGHVRAF